MYYDIHVIELTRTRLSARLPRVRVPLRAILQLLLLLFATHLGKLL